MSSLIDRIKTFFNYNLILYGIGLIFVGGVLDNFNEGDGWFEIFIVAIINIGSSLFVAGVIAHLTSYIFKKGGVDDKPINIIKELNTSANIVKDYLISQNHALVIADSSKYLEKLLSNFNADCNEIHIISHGFSCHTSSSKAKAKRMLESLEEILRKGKVNVHYFQYYAVMGKTWLSYLTDLKSRFPNNIFIHIDEDIIGSKQLFNFFQFRWEDSTIKSFLMFPKLADYDNYGNQEFGFAIEYYHSITQDNYYKSIFSPFFKDTTQKTSTELVSISKDRIDRQEELAATKFDALKNSGKRIPIKTDDLLNFIKELNSDYPKKIDFTIQDTDIFREKAFEILNESNELLFTYGLYMDKATLEGALKEKINKFFPVEIGLVELKQHKVKVIKVKKNRQVKIDVFPTIIEVDSEEIVYGKLYQISSGWIEVLLNRNQILSFEVAKEEVEYVYEGRKYKVIASVLRSKEISATGNAKLDKKYKEKMIKSLESIGAPSKYIEGIKKL